MVGSHCRPREIGADDEDEEEEEEAVRELMMCWLRSKSIDPRPADERNAREAGEEGAVGVGVGRERAAEARVGRLYRLIDEEEDEEEEEGG